VSPVDSEPASDRAFASGGQAPLYSPAGLREALLSFETRLGTPVQALSLRILPDRALLQATPGATPDVVDQYEFISGHLLGPTRVTLTGTGELGDNLFRLRSVELEKLPSLVEEVTRSSNGARVTLVTIKRDLPQSGETRFALSLSGNGPDQVVLANRHGVVLRGSAATSE
jgi:hypothetical protein